MQTVLPFTALCYSSRYFPAVANEPEVLQIHRKRLTSMLKNKVDTNSKIYWIYYIWYWRTDRNVKEEREDKLYCAFVLVLKNVVKLVVWLPNTEEHSVRPWLECLWALSQPLAAACQPLWALLCASAGSSPHTPPLPAHTAPPLHVIKSLPAHSWWNKNREVCDTFIHMLCAFQWSIVLH